MLKKLAAILAALALAVSTASAQLTVSQLTGFNAGGGDPPTLSFIGCTVDTADLTTYTFTAASIGTAGDRSVIVAALGRDGTATFDVSSLTVGGSGATEIIDANTAQLTNGAIYIISYPTGTTADIVVTWSEAITSAVICVWDAKHLNSTTAVATQTGNDGGGAALALDLNVSALGVAVGACTDTNTGAVTTWTGMTERADASTGTNHAYSAADYVATTASTPLSVTCDQSTGGGTVGISASFR